MMQFEEDPQSQSSADAPTPFEELDVSVLMVDLRGYTALGALHPPAVLIDVLNRFLAAMSDIVMQHHGSVDKFMGDAVMAVFGAPRAQLDHALQAVACAAGMQQAMERINQENRERGLPDVYAGIGINTGTVLAGWLGSSLHREYSVIGEAVNLASRIESFSLRGQVLIGESTWALVRDRLEVGEPTRIHVKGKSQPIVVFELLGIPDLQLKVVRRDLRRSQRVRVNMPFTFQRLDGKIVNPQVHEGVVHDIGYQGILADLHNQAAEFDDIKLSIDLSPLGYRAADVYGKVLHTKKLDGIPLSAVEFTSVTLQSDTSIRQFVQMLLQGCEETR
jgi:adenylate cyclase